MLSQRRVDEVVGLDRGEACPGAFEEEGDLEAEVGWAGIWDVGC